MKSLKSLVCVVLVLAICIMATPWTYAQCITNPDGTITCPTLAPPLPAAQVAQATQDTTASADRLTLRERRQMGFTRLAVIRATTKLARAGELPSTKGLSGADLVRTKCSVDCTAAHYI